MTGKSGKYTFLILAIAAFAVAGCSVPVGLVGEGLASSPSVYGSFLVNPIRLSYETNERFQRYDFEAFETNGDERRSVIYECEIRVIHDSSVTAVYDLVPQSGGLLLTTGGMKLIQVRYKSFPLYQYYIHVMGPPAGESNPPGINIIWV